MIYAAVAARRQEKTLAGAWEIAAADGESDADDGEIVAEARETETELAEIGPADVEIVAEREEIFAGDD